MKLFNLKNVTVMFFILGMAILYWEGIKVSGTFTLADNYDVAFGIVTAAVIGLILRGMSRRVFWGTRLSWHQSLSFETISEGLTRLNPWINYYGFEKWFTIRETGLDEHEVDCWIYLRSRLLWIFSIAGLTLALAALSKPGATMLTGTIGIIIAIWFVTAAGRHRKDLLRMTLFYLVIFAIEGGIFILCASYCLSVTEAAALYLLFSLFYYFSPIPYGLGFAELPILLIPGRAPWDILLLFHIGKIGPLLLLQAIYWSRYKFQVDDFFSESVIEKIRSSIRPAAGWPDQFAGEKDKPEVSVVIPAYNEELRLPVYLEKIKEYMTAHPELRMEILVVDDGSKDRTAALVEAENARDPRFKLIRQIPNKGKGAAVRRGMLLATGHYVVYADADGATPIEELDKLLTTARNGAEIVIGSRRLAAQAEERQRNPLRALMGMVFYKTVNYFAVPGIKDSQCGFKMFRRDVALRLFAMGAETGWAFDVEILYLAQLYGFAITEVPVNWHEIAGSKVSPVKDALKMLVAVFRIRNRHRGFFNKNFIGKPGK